MNIATNLKSVKRGDITPYGYNKRGNFRTRNYFYRVFDNIGSQLAAVNQGLKDQGPVRTYQFK